MWGLCLLLKISLTNICCACVCLVAQSYLTLCDQSDCSPPGFSVHGILQVRILEWVAISSSRGSSWLRDWSHISCIGRWILYHWATWEALSAYYVQRIVIISVDSALEQNYSLVGWEKCMHKVWGGEIGTRRFLSFFFFGLSWYVYMQACTYICIYIG